MQSVQAKDISASVSLSLSLSLVLSISICLTLSPLCVLNCVKFGTQKFQFKLKSEWGRMMVETTSSEFFERKSNATALRLNIGTT